jgi:hypothetical protein
MELVAGRVGEGRDVRALGSIRVHSLEQLGDDRAPDAAPLMLGIDGHVDQLQEAASTGRSDWGCRGAIGRGSR